MGLLKHLKSAASLFVETPSEPPKPELKSDDVPSLDDIDLALPPEAQLRRGAAANSGVSRAASATTLGEKLPDSELDFAELYAHFGIVRAAFSAEQLAQIIANLPDELDADGRRETVRAVLGALEAQGVTPEKVVADATRKIAAINAAIGQIEARANENVENLEARIADLQQQLDAARREIIETRTRQSRLKHECEDKLGQMTTTREFFGPTVAAAGERLARDEAKNPN